ncbi:hypothetical protein VNI00_004171 [Paramarasmius palmivorus]|uniref:Uncharacterized protein n=1 Tax=Paramarasmius palmivorus TaxID=297713 RepID=A0AAW0DNC4_9AGAR
MSYNDCSISSFEFARLEVMDTQRFDTSIKQGSPAPCLQSPSPEAIPSARDENNHLEGFDSQRFDISQKQRVEAPRVMSLTAEFMPSARDEGDRLEEFDSQRFDVSKKRMVETPRMQSPTAEFIPSARDETDRLEAFDNQRFDLSKKERSVSLSVKSPESEATEETTTINGDDASSEQSRKLLELWKALNPRFTRSATTVSNKDPNKDSNRITLSDDECSAFLSGASSLVSPLSDSDHAGSIISASTPATSDNGHIIDDCETESVVQDLPPHSIALSLDTGEVHITDHIVKFGGTTTRTIVRPVPKSAASTSLKGPLSRPTSPLQALNCFNTETFEEEVDQVCEERQKRLAGEGEIKIFVEEKVSKHRQQLRVPFQEIQLGQVEERPLAKC